MPIKVEHCCLLLALESSPIVRLRTYACQSDPPAYRTTVDKSPANTAKPWSSLKHTSFLATLEFEFGSQIT